MRVLFFVEISFRLCLWQQEESFLEHGLSDIQPIVSSLQESASSAARIGPQPVGSCRSFRADDIQSKLSCLRNLSAIG